MLGAPRKCVSQNAPCLPMLAPQPANRAPSPTQLHGKDRIDQSASRAPTDRTLGRRIRKRNEQNPSSPSRSRSVVLLDLPEVHRRELFSMGRLAALQQRRRRRER